jgi:hypothetical protein
MMKKIYLDELLIFDTPIYRNDGYLWCRLTSKDIELLHQTARALKLSSTVKRYYEINNRMGRSRIKALGAVQVTHDQFNSYLLHYGF